MFLVNGAGLAMATMDLLKLYGGSPANFLDIGGTATEDQVYNAFRIITMDPHVKVIFVNIFAGILDCAMIGEGLLKAIDRLELNVIVFCDVLRSGLNNSILCCRFLA